MQYAKKTDVSVAKSRAEIEDTVQRYGASGFMSGWQGSFSMIGFEIHDRRLRFLLPLPDRASEDFTHVMDGRTKMLRPRSADAAIATWEQACRQRWRALALTIKAKLEAVETGITTFDEEFLAHIVCADGLTISEKLVPRLSEIASTGNMPPLLPGPPAR